MYFDGERVLRVARQAVASNDSARSTSTYLLSRASIYRLAGFPLIVESNLVQLYCASNWSSDCFTPLFTCFAKLMRTQPKVFAMHSNSKSAVVNLLARNALCDAIFGNSAWLKVVFCTAMLNIAIAWLLSNLRAECQGQEPIRVSGIYPHLAMFNNENECGTGAVVPWAGHLWVVTYGPHEPQGSTDKLYQISENLEQQVRPESIGGTPANRMIHAESQQLFIGPYAIDSKGKVRVIPYSQMFGRPTGNARHLFDPANKIYCASMEEGLYEIDVETLAVNELWADEQLKEGRHSDLTGYHGKGLYSGQGRIVYANNGEHGAEALKRPEVPSGVLAEWDGEADRWTEVRRNQFTEVTGPAGIQGDGNTTDPIWSIGWDHRSLILMCLDGGTWHSYRLPKASHSYDGAHGWNTEWPRIRDIGEEHLLMTMHGMFWQFPKSFQHSNSAGIAPRSSYLKVVGDFCRWRDQIVLGCDDTAKSEFLNKRKAKGQIAAPQSQSNLWFLQPEQLDTLGPVVGRGAIWLNDDVKDNAVSEPFLFSGFDRRSVHLAHASRRPVKLTLEIDVDGTNQWKKLQDVKLLAGASQWIDLSDAPKAAWIRAKCDQPATRLTVQFAFSNLDERPAVADSKFDGLALPTETKLSGGTVRARGENKRTLHFLASEPAAATSINTSPANSPNNNSARNNNELALYELDGDLKLRKVNDAAATNYERTHAAIPDGVLAADEASVIYVDDSGHRWRLPRSNASGGLNTSLGASRACREVATERDLFNAAGTFYELPAENAGGFSKVRAVATHDRQIVDYCSYRGLLILSGVSQTAANSPHIVRSDDGKAALWVGAIDDVWTLGKPRGIGGPWNQTAVTANRPSDPYLLNGFDRKSLTISHQANSAVTFSVECDVTGAGDWLAYSTVTLKADEDFQHRFPEAFSAYWLRITPSAACIATALLTYE